MLAQRPFGSSKYLKNAPVIKHKTNIIVTREKSSAEQDSGL